jgi:hypothetical protein
MPERNQVMRDFLAWGSKQDSRSHGGNPFPYGTIGYWVGKYLEDPPRPHRYPTTSRQCGRLGGTTPMGCYDRTAGNNQPAT